MGDLGGLQLLPSQKRSYAALRVQGKSRLLLIAFMLLLVLGVAYVVMLVVANQVQSNVAATEQNILAIYKKRNKTDEEKLLNFQKQLGTTRTLLQAHTIWSAGFIGIQKLIEPRMKFLSFQADTDKHSYSFHAVADSYTTVAKQIAALYGSALVQDVRVSAISAVANGQVDVTMELILTYHE